MAPFPELAAPDGTNGTNQTSMSDRDFILKRMSMIFYSTIFIRQNP